MTTLHIVFGDSAAGTLRQVLKVRGSADEVASFPDDLSWGPIAGDIEERVRYFDVESPIPGSWGWLPDAHAQFWQEVAQPADERLIWLSSSAPDELSAYFAYLQRLSGLGGSVLRSDRCLPAHPVYGPMLGTGTLNAEQMAEVLDNAPRTEVGEDQALFGRWEELQREAALLRVVEDGALVSAPVDKYDELLLANAGPDWTVGIRIIGNAISDSFDRQFRVNPDFLFSRLSHLVKSAMLEADGDVLGWEEDGRRHVANVRRAS